jgi:glyoxylase-like metal-dependent hydrolase (beta-lactamase superfamily II)
MDVRSFTVGAVAENCYLLRGDDSDRALIVDPGDEADRILHPVDELGLTVEAILITHCHFDHIGAVAPVARATEAPVYCPEIEVPVLANIMDWVPGPFGPFESYDADETVSGGERLELAGFGIDVVATPGHSPGHQSLVVDQADGPTILTGQAVYGIDEWTGAPGREGASSARDRAAYDRSVRRLRDVDPVRVLFAHDRRPWVR